MLIKWKKTNGILGKEHAGLQKEYSARGNIFRLFCIVGMKFREGKKLYSFFVDSFCKSLEYVVLYRQES